MILPMRKYNIIHADPPWGGSDTHRDYYKKTYYGTMENSDIVALPIREIADVNCSLFLWVIESSLPDAFKVIEAWGFKYRCVAFVWVKRTTRNNEFFGLGTWTRKGAELCLLATRGKVERSNRSVRQVQYAMACRHSEKPAIVKESIVTLIGDVPRVDLFGRLPIDGWDVCGNECISCMGDLYVNDGVY